MKRILMTILIVFNVGCLVACGGKENTTNEANENHISAENSADATTEEVDINPTDTTLPDEHVKSDETDNSTILPDFFDKPTEEDNELPDGPTNPSHRKMYTLSNEDYQSYLNGSSTLEEICALYDSYGMVSNETIEYTDQGYIVTSRFDYADYGASFDIISTYNNRGELVHEKSIIYDSYSPEGQVASDNKYIQYHYIGEAYDGYTPLDNTIEVTDNNKIASITEVAAELAVDHKCSLPYYVGAIQKDNRTILYDASTVEIFDVTTRTNTTAIANGSFEIITYNSMGKVESIYVCAGRLSEGLDHDGNYYTTIQDYIDYAINNDMGQIQATWSYDNKGNLVHFSGNDVHEIYIYE